MEKPRQEEEAADFLIEMNVMVGKYGLERLQEYLATLRSQQETAKSSEPLTGHAATVETIKERYPAVFSQKAFPEMVEKLKEWSENPDKYTDIDPEDLSSPEQSARLFILDSIKSAAEQVGLALYAVERPIRGHKDKDITASWVSGGEYYHAVLQLSGLGSYFYVPNAKEDSSLHIAGEVQRTLRDAGIDNVKIYDTPTNTEVSAVDRRV